MGVGLGVQRTSKANGVGPVIRRYWHPLGLHVRLAVLVIASILPLITFGAVREYLDYRSEREAIYNGLVAFARSTAIATERDLQLHIAAMQVLATSPALESGDLAGFDAQARAFLSRQPADTILGLAKPDQTIGRIYGLPPGTKSPGDSAGLIAPNAGVFTTRQPIVSDLRGGTAPGSSSFTVSVPVFRGDLVEYELFLTVRPDTMQQLLTRQRLPPPFGGYDYR